VDSARKLEPRGPSGLVLSSISGPGWRPSAIREALETCLAFPNPGEALRTAAPAYGDYAPAQSRNGLRG
jgi:hypothetical protein